MKEKAIIKKTSMSDEEIAEKKSDIFNGIVKVKEALFSLEYAVETGYFGSTEESMASVANEVKELLSNVSEYIGEES